MRLLVDECTGPTVARWLLDQGHEVFSVYDHSRGISDSEILEKAYAEAWIVVTNDKDFGAKVFREKSPHHGVILLRLEDERAVMKIDVLDTLLKTYGDQLEDAFVVASETVVRFGKP